MNKERWKDIKKSIAEWNNRGLKEVLFPDYIFKPIIFYICFALIVIMALVIMARHDFNFKQQFYYNCPENGPICENPFYSSPGQFYSSNSECPIEDKNFCLQEYFLPGYSYGSNKPRDISMYPLFCLSVFAIGFVFNHLIFNRRKLK